MLHSLGYDNTRHSVEPDIDQNCLQRPADNKGKTFGVGNS